MLAHPEWGWLSSSWPVWEMVFPRVIPQDRHLDRICPAHLFLLDALFRLPVLPRTFFPDVR